MFHLLAAPAAALAAPKRPSLPLVGAAAAAACIAAHRDLLCMAISNADYMHLGRVSKEKIPAVRKNGEKEFLKITSSIISLKPSDVCYFYGLFYLNLRCPLNSIG